MKEDKSKSYPPFCPTTQNDNDNQERWYNKSAEMMLKVVKLFYLISFTCLISYFINAE